MTVVNRVIDLGRGVLDSARAVFVDDATEAVPAEQPPITDSHAVTEAGPALAVGQAIAVAPMVATPVEPETDLNDYGPDVVEVEPTPHGMRLRIRFTEDLIGDYTEYDDGPDGYRLYDFRSIDTTQHDAWWTINYGRERVFQVPPGLSIGIVEPGDPCKLIVGEIYNGYQFLDLRGNTIHFKLPSVQYRDHLDGLNGNWPITTFLAAVVNFPRLTLIDFMGFYEGAILGDAIEEPSVAQLAGQIVTGFIPVVGQIADARDTAIAIERVWRTGGAEGKLNLGAALLGWVPYGDLLKRANRIREMVRGDATITLLRMTPDGQPTVFARVGDDLRHFTPDEVDVLVRGIGELAQTTAFRRAAQAFDGPRMDEFVLSALQRLIDRGFVPRNRAHLGSVLHGMIAQRLRREGVEAGDILKRVMIERRFMWVADFPPALAQMSIRQFVTDFLPQHEAELRHLFRSPRTGKDRLIGNLTPDLIAEIAPGQYLVWDLTSRESVHLAKTILYTQITAEWMRMTGRDPVLYTISETLYRSLIPANWFP